LIFIESDAKVSISRNNATLVKAKTFGFGVNKDKVSLKIKLF